MCEEVAMYFRSILEAIAGEGERKRGYELLKRCTIVPGQPIFDVSSAPFLFVLRLYQYNCSHLSAIIVGILCRMWSLLSLLYTLNVIIITFILSLSSVCIVYFYYY